MFKAFGRRRFSQRAQARSSSGRAACRRAQVLLRIAFAIATMPMARQLPAGDTYAAWLSRHLTPAQLLDPSLSAEFSTPLGDSAPNLLKYALGLSPFAAPSPRLPRWEQTLAGPVWHLSLSGLQPLDLAIIPEVSTDMQIWRRGPAWTRLQTEEPGDWTVRRYLPGEEAERSLALGQNLHFRLRVERSGTLPSEWQAQWFGATGIDPNADHDGDGRSNWQEYLEGTDPQDFYDGRDAFLEIVSGTAQSGAPSTWLPDAMVVRVRQTASGVALPNAPVRFTPVAWGAAVGLEATGHGAANAPLVVRTDATGLARIRHRLPSLSVESPVRAAVQLRSGEGAQVVLTAVSYDPAVPPPAAPLFLIVPSADGNPEGPLELSWDSPATNTDGFRLERYDSAGHAFQVLRTFDSSARAASLSAPPPGAVLRLVAFNVLGDSAPSVLLDTLGRALAGLDSDGDGLNDEVELITGLDRFASDSDADGIPDGQDGAPLDAELQALRPPEKAGFAQISLDGFVALSIAANGVMHGSRHGQPGFWRRGVFSPYSYPASWNHVNGVMERISSELDPHSENPRVLVTLRYIYYADRPGVGSELPSKAGPQLGPYPGGEYTTMMATLLENGAVEVTADVLPGSLHCAHAGFLSGGRVAYKVGRPTTGNPAWTIEIHGAGGLLRTLDFQGLAQDLDLVGTDGNDEVLGRQKLSGVRRYVVWNASTGLARDLGPAAARLGVRDMFLGPDSVVLGNAANGRASYWNLVKAVAGRPLPQLDLATAVAALPPDDSYEIVDALPAEGRAILRKVSGSGPAFQMWQNSRLVQLSHLDHTLTGVPNKIGPGGLASVSTSGGKLLVPAQLVPDWNRDGRIDHFDRDQATAQRPFRWWINDDSDVGDIASGDSDVPAAHSRGVNANFSDNAVNGLSDVIDFFPVHLDIAALLRVLPPASYGYRLRHAEGALRFVYTSLAPHELRQFLLESARADYGPGRNQRLSEATSQLVAPHGTNLTSAFLSLISSGRGVLLFEGTAPTAQPLLLDVTDAGTVVATIALPVSLAGVEQMYRHSTYGVF